MSCKSFTWIEAQQLTLSCNCDKGLHNNAMKVETLKKKKPMEKNISKEFASVDQHPAEGERDPCPVIQSHPPGKNSPQDHFCSPGNHKRCERMIFTYDYAYQRTLQHFLSKLPQGTLTLDLMTQHLWNLPSTTKDSVENCYK